MNQVFEKRPLYHQLRDELAGQIFDGRLKPSAAIENEIDLAKKYSVSVGTMRKALAMLESEGLISRRQGRGSFVSEPNAPGLRERFEHIYRRNGHKIETDVRQIGCHSSPATPEEQTRLLVTSNDNVVCCKQVVRVDNIPKIYREARFSVALHPEPELTQTWDVFSASRNCGFWIGNGIAKLYLKQAGDQVVAALGLEVGATLLVLDRLLFALDGKPIEWLVSWCEFSGLYYETTLS